METRGIDFERSNFERPPKGVNYILAIGIDHYTHWPPLNNAVKDIKDLLEVVTRQYQFDPEYIHTLYDEQATEANIYAKIRELKRKITPEDNLVVYYSGHGHYDEDFDEGYWVPVNAERDKEDRFISNSNIIKKINAIDAHHTLLVVDSCFSGTLVVRKRAAIMDEKFRSRRIIASGRQETVTDGRAGENSPFAAGILTYLKRNTERSVNTTSLVQYVKEYMLGKAQQTPVEGRIQNSDDEGGEFVFHLKLLEADIWKNVQATNTVEAYENYLDYFPSGKFAAIAQKAVLQLGEDQFWKSTLLKDNDLAYETYLKKYAPNGKYMGEARDRLDALREKQHERQRILEELSEKEEERRNIQERFQRLIQEAEGLFSNKQLDQALDRYRESLRYYMEGFVPDHDYIDEQISLCTSGMQFLGHFENGKRAMKQGNYRLALQYFNEARKIDDSPRMDDLIKVCRQKLDGGPGTPLMEETIYGKPARPAGNQNTEKTTEATKSSHQEKKHPEPKPKKKKKRKGLTVFLTVLFTLFGVFIGLLILGAIINERNGNQPSIERLSNTPSINSSKDELTITDLKEERQRRVIDENSTNSARTDYGTLIQGVWQVVDLENNGQSISGDMQSMMQNLGLAGELNTIYTFSSNNNVQVMSSFGYANAKYYINNSRKAFTLRYSYSDAYGNPIKLDYNGSIRKLDRTNLHILIQSVSDGYTTYPVNMKYLLRRQER